MSKLQEIHARRRADARTHYITRLAQAVAMVKMLMSWVRDSQQLHCPRVGPSPWHSASRPVEIHGNPGMTML